MDEDDPLREKFINGAKRMMNSLIDHYTTKNLPDANGLLIHATYNYNSKMGIDEMNIWGDYFYMEALHRMLDAEWEMYW
jgi:unsaturated chondroitin disaccharide hydrolase